MRVLSYLIGNLGALKSLVLILLFQFLWVLVNAFSPIPKPTSKVYQKCKEINASYELIKETNTGDNNSIKINLKDVQISQLNISLVGPKKMFLQDINEYEIKNLSKGTYSLVLVGREESLGFCPKHFQVIIK